MPTQRQRLAVKEISENFRNPVVRFSIGGAMKKAGYTELTSLKPQVLTESKGFKELCEEVGLTDSMILTAIADDIKNKPKDRSKELAIACKVKGLYKADNEQKQVAPEIPDADFIEIIRAYKVRR